MATHNLGRVAYADKGAYNSSTTYINKDVVQYNNGSYVLQADTATGIVPTNTSYWTPMQDPTALNQATASANTAAQSANTAANSAVKAAETANTVMNNTASPIRKSATGKFIELDNAANKPLAGLRLYGRTEQATTTGKNLLPINSVNTSQNHAGFVELTYLTVGTYTLSADITKYANDTATHTRLGCKVEYTDGTTENFSCPIDELNAERDGIARKKQATFHIRSDKTFKAIYIWLLDYSDVSGGRNAKAEHAQLERGSVATSYEPYTGGVPSPSPNWPQPLVSPGDSGSIGVYSKGKNLLPPSGETWTMPATSALGWGSPSIAIQNTLPIGQPLVASVFFTDGTKQTDRRAVLGLLDSAGNIIQSTGFEPGDMISALSANEANRIKSWYLYFNELGVADNAGKTILGVQLEVGTAATAYEPYKNGGSLTASTPNGLPGIPVTSGGNYVDANGQQWICDEKDYERGVYVQRVMKLTIDGSADELIRKNTTDSNDWLHYIELPYAKQFFSRGYCDKLQEREIYMLQQYGGIGYLLNTEYGICYINMSSYMEDNSVAALRNVLAANPITIIYILKTPIETPIPADELAAYRAMMSQYPHTTVYSDSDVEMTVDYIGETEKFVHEVIDDRAAPPIVEIASGSVVSITDGANRPAVDLISHIEPLQSGSGDASPNNVRPISGWDSVTAYARGKNLFYSDARTSSWNGATCTVNGNHFVLAGTPTVSGGRLALTSSSIILPPGTYIMSNANRTTSLQPDIFVQSGSAIIGNRNVPFTLAEPTSVYIGVNVAAGTDHALEFDVQIEAGTTATAYEPYQQGKTLPASLPETVYGGKLNWTTGVLTVTHKQGVVNNAVELYGNVVSTDLTGFYLTIADMAAEGRANGWCEILPARNTPSGATKPCITFGVGYHDLFVVMPTTIVGTTIETINAYLAANPLTIVYPLATPYTIQLTPQQLDTLKGNNNVWSNCGSTELSYVADTKSYIDKKLADIAATLI